MLSMFGRGEEPKLGATPTLARPGREGPTAAPIPLPQKPANVNANAAAGASAAPTRAEVAARAVAVAGSRAKLFENPPTVGQYLYHLAADVRNFTRAEINGTVAGATPAEVQRLARLTAKLKGRYLAYALDLAGSEHGPVGEVDVRHLERARFMYEEVERALDALRQSIETGDLALEGLKRD
ncbi:MAG TPA: hypothetical protein VGM59_12780 [Dongiaceae bacterium]